MSGQNLVVIEGRVLGSVKHFDDSRLKTVFTVTRGRDRFYVESQGCLLDVSASKVLVIGQLFSRRIEGRDYAGIQATQVVRLEVEEEARDQ